MGDVLLVEDLGFVAEATKWMIETVDPAAKVVVTATAGEVMAALDCKSRRWRLILLELDVPGARELSLIHRISALGLAPITCALAASDDPRVPTLLCEAGFLGFVPKGRAGAGRLKEVLLHALCREPASSCTPTGKELLTRRQATTLQLVASGMTSTQIAREMGTRASNVDGDVGCAMYALGAHTRAGAVDRAVALGLIQDLRCAASCA